MYQKDKDRDSHGYFYSGISAGSLTPRSGLPFPEDQSSNSVSQFVSNRDDFT